MASSSELTNYSLELPNKSDADYQKRRQETDLREPYRFPPEILEGTKETVVEYDVAESPLIAFINARSGGRMGPSLKNALFRSLGHSQVYDLPSDRPDKVLSAIWENLELMEKNGDSRATEIKHHMKIVACGGDGTVAWVLKVIKDLELDPAPAVCILPLGTGNDLSRTFKWGSSFNKNWISTPENLYKHLKKMSDASYCNLDCWNVSLKSSEKGFFEDLPHSLRKKDESGLLASGCAWNYISFGMDAQSAYGFHHLRETHPAFASGRLINQFWYGFFGCKSGWFCCCNQLNPPINWSLKLEILSNKDEWKEIKIPDSVKALVIVNLQSYAGGRNIWGKAKLSKKEIQQGMTEPKFNDGLFEVVGFQTGWHTGLVLTSISHGVRLAQGKGARIKLHRAKQDPAGEHEYLHTQIDGEPWKQKLPTSDKQELKMDIIYNGYSRMLMSNIGASQSSVPAKAENITPPVIVEKP